MRENRDNPIVWVDGVDDEMATAMAQAQKTFKYLWRELTWEYRRIVPALDLSAVKAAFHDTEDESAGIEHMWLSEIQFNGDYIVATLLNSPNRLHSVKEGDCVSLRLEHLEDWIYAMNGQVFGGFTIQRLRASMSPSARRQHDSAWGLKFPDPNQVELVPGWPAEPKRGRLAGILGSKRAVNEGPDQEHPMSENMAAGLAKAIDAKPEEFLRSRDKDGLTMLHSLALGGSEACVRVLLEKGADPSMKTNAGHTALDLSEIMNWPRVAELLRAAG